nr:hypothetical transcript [Hymenolepis microstoma]
MSFAPETEYVKCKFCSRKFFATSYEKHISSCEREWVRANCREENKSSKESGPYVKAHVTGYEVQVKTFADMLSLGAERRKRWRLRHKEFIHSIKAAKAAIGRGDKSDTFLELDPEVTYAGLTQCEYCKRRFNDGAYLKHVEQCRVKQTDLKVQLTEEQKEAKERFTKRMKYNTKLVGKGQSEKEIFDPEEQSNNKGDTSETTEVHFNQEQCGLIDKLADKLRSDLKVFQMPTAEVIQTDALKKIIKKASFPCFSESDSATSPPVVLTNTSISHEKLKSSNHKLPKSSNVQFASGSSIQNDCIAYLNSNGSSHYPRSSLKLPSTSIDGIPINDINSNYNCQISQNDNASTNWKNKVKSDFEIIIEESDQFVGHHHKLHKSSRHHKSTHNYSEAEKDSDMLNYNCNGSEQINMHQKYQLQMNTPSKRQATMEGNPTSKLVLHDEDHKGTDSLNNQSLHESMSRKSNVCYLSCLPSPGVQSSGNDDTLKESQPHNIETASYHSKHHHHKHLDMPKNSSNTLSLHQSQSSQMGNTVSNLEGSSKKSKSRYCTQCGEKFDLDARFCSSCGAIRKSKISGGKCP